MSEAQSLAARRGREAHTCHPPHWGATDLDLVFVVGTECVLQTRIKSRDCPYMIYDRAQDIKVKRFSIVSIVQHLVATHTLKIHTNIFVNCDHSNYTKH